MHTLHALSKILRRRHIIRVHNLACDTLVQGRPFPHVGYTMRRPNAREMHYFPRTIFPDDWAVSYRKDIDPESVFDRPPFGHRFVGVWPDIRCVPITNSDGSDNMFGQNRSVTVDTVTVHRADYFVNGQLQMLRARSITQKRHRESP